FFFQAEDGIRDYKVTGVQTCALPISPSYLTWLAAMAVESGRARNVLVFRALNGRSGARVGTMQFHGMGAQFRYPIGYDSYLMYEIGRASCRERGEVWVGARGRVKRGG